MSDPPEPSELHLRAQARVGSTVRGKYRLDGILGVGGMATVYSATHRNAKRFAVKMLHPELSMRGDIRARFLREGYAANSVGHPGTVSVLDDDVTDDGAAFIVMELLEGSAVDALWARHGRRLPVSAAASIGDQLLDVLAAAHARGIVHRDIKPANLFVVADGTLKVLDFGIARARDAAFADATGPGGVTGTGMVLGTPAFMAPEQALARSTEIDAQTDLWAAGATLFTLLSGRLVHQGENATHLLVLAATARAPSVLAVAPGLPGPIAQVIDRGLVFEKAGRWASAAAMRDALREAYRAVSGGAPTERITLDRMGFERVPEIAAAHDIAAPTAPIVTPHVTPLGPWPRPPGSPSSPVVASASASASASADATSGPPWAAAPGGTTSRAVASGPHRVNGAASTATRGKAPIVAAGLVASVVLLVGVGVGVHALGSTVTGPLTGPASTSPDVPTRGASLVVAPPPSTEVALALVAPPDDRVEAQVVDASASAVPSRPIADTAAPPVKRATAAPAATPAQAPAPPVRVNCTPPFYYDAQGNRVFKKECL